MISESTTRCEFCGRPLTYDEVPSPFRGIDPIAIYRPCSCAEAAKAHAEKVARQAEEEAERRERETRDALLRAGVGERFADAEHERAGELADKVATGRSLYIHGPFGTGKTHLAAAMARILASRKFRFEFRTGIGLTMMLQATYGRTDSELAVIGRLSRTGVLFVDDLGKEPPTDWALSRLFAIVNDRYVEGRPMVVTSNYTRGQLVKRLSKNGDADTAEAIASRLHEMCDTVHLDGPDRRLA